MKMPHVFYSTMSVAPFSQLKLFFIVTSPNPLCIVTFVGDEIANHGVGSIDQFSVSELLQTKCPSAVTTA